jgi:hypothetical protein
VSSVQRENLQVVHAVSSNYQIFGSFKELSSGLESLTSPSEKFSSCSTQSSEFPKGIFQISPSCPESSTWTDVPKGYLARAASCAVPKNGLKLRCAFFVTIFTPVDPSLKWSPIVVFKGTTEVAEWKANLFNRGANLVQDFFSDLLLHKERDGASNKFVEALQLISKDFYNGRLIFAGHSLGGAMAQNMSIAYQKYLRDVKKVSPLSPVQLLTFNSLAASSLSRNLKIEMVVNPFAQTIADLFGPISQSLNIVGSKAMSRALGESNDRVVKGLGILARNFVTADDPLQIMNRNAKSQNIGPTLLLPSRQQIGGYGMFYSRNLFGPGLEPFFTTLAISGHRIQSVIDDIEYLYSKSMLSHRLDLQVGQISLAEFNLNRDRIIKSNVSQFSLTSDSHDDRVREESQRAYYLSKKMDKQYMRGQEVIGLILNGFEKHTNEYY